MSLQSVTPTQAVATALAAIFAIFLSRAAAKYLRTRKYPYPPGPKPLPLIGNLLDMPTEKQWLTYDAWHKKYGDMVYLNALGTPMLVLGSTRRTRDLFDKRSSINSDRAHFTMSCDLVGFDYMFAQMHYGDWWRRHRRAFHQYFHAGIVGKYQPVQAAASRGFLRRLHTDPDHLSKHIRRTFSATILKISYDIDVRGADNEYVSLAEETLEVLAKVILPGAYLVDILPILKHVPSWMPGAGFKRQAAEWRRLTSAFRDKPFDAVKDAMRRGENPSCVAASLVENIANTGKDQLQGGEEDVAKNIAAIAYAGGADTTVSAVQTFFLAMVLYPEVQRTAQAEIDVIVGSDRLPEFADRPSLPYVNAVVKESMRWQVVTPLGVPHATTEDQVYDGYFIPKGTILMGNSWSILHDPDTYAAPDQFKPERYLKDGQLNRDIPDPGAVGAFGFGRRICPGRYLSDNSLYSIVSSVLAVYDIHPIRGGALPKAEMSDGFLSYPLPYQCEIKPRSAAAEALIAEIGDV